MGLAILPPRLLQEAELMEQALSCPEGAEEIFKETGDGKASGLVCRFESGRSYGGECRPGCGRASEKFLRRFWETPAFLRIRKREKRLSSAFVKPYEPGEKICAG